jgi:hypothetical protein
MHIKKNDGHKRVANDNYTKLNEPNIGLRAKVGSPLKKHPVQS